jgi:hypothetical protein
VTPVSGEDAAMQRARDIGWTAFAGLCTIFGLLAALGVVVAVARRDWFLAATAPLYALGAYWLAAGAWLRTTRGADDLGEPPPPPPALSRAWAQRYVAGAAACALACGVAFLVQFIQTR